MNVNPTAEVIDNIAKRLRERANDFDRIAAKMRETGDMRYAAEAMSEVSNLIPSLRIDLLVTRPLREYERQNKD